MVKVAIIIVVISVFLFSCNYEQKLEDREVQNEDNYLEEYYIVNEDGTIDTILIDERVNLTYEEYFTVSPCDSFFLGSKSFLRDREIAFKSSSSQLIRFDKNHNLTVSQTIEKITEKYSLIDDIIEVNNIGMICSYICYFAYNPQLIIEINFCFHQPLPPSCCGIGGQFASENTLDYEKHQMNYELIKDLKDYTIFQFVGYDWILGATEIRMQRKNKQQDYNDN